MTLDLKERIAVPTPARAAGNAHATGVTTPSRRTTVLLALLFGLGLAGMASVAWVIGNADAPSGEVGTAGGGEVAAEGHDHDGGGHDHDGGGVVGGGFDTVGVGEPTTATLEGGAGQVTLGLTTQVPAGQSIGRLSAVPPGRPVTISVSVTAGAAPALPELSLQRLADDGSTEPVPLDRPETFLLNTGDGSLALPAGAAAHDHGAGRGLTQGMPGGGFAWATSIRSVPDDVAADSSGRWLAAVQADEGIVQLVDLLARAEPVTVEVEGRPEALWFAPSGQLWVGDHQGQRLHVIDPASAATTARLDLAHPPAHVTFTDDGGTALATGDRIVSVIDVARGEVRTTGEVRGDATAATFAPAVGEFGMFALAHADGAVTLLPVTPDGTIGEGSSVDLGSSARGTSAIATAPDGRTLVTANEVADTVAVVDAITAEVRAVVPAGEQPAEIGFLDDFAVVRNAGSAELTWVDLADPSKSGNEALGSAPPASMTVEAGGGQVLLPSPVESRVYLLHTMMGRPMVMGSEDAPTGADLAVSTTTSLRPVDGEVLHDHAEGTSSSGHPHDEVYAQDVVLDQIGRYELTVSVNGATASFPIEVAPLEGPPVVVAPVDVPPTAIVGETVTVSFVSSVSAQLDRPEVLAVINDAQGINQVRAPARHVGGDHYAADLVLSRSGRWSVTLLAETSGVNPETSEQTHIDVQDPQS